MGEARTPFELVDLVTKPPLSIPPRVSDDIQQTLATLVGYDGSARRLLRVTSTGMLEVVNPLAQGFINIFDHGANYVWQGDDIKCSEVVVRAYPTNASRVWVNVYSVAADNVGWLLDRNEHITLTITNLLHLHLKILAAGEKAMIYYT